MQSHTVPLPTCTFCSSSHLAGMSMFSTKGGLYERAQRRFKVQDGKKLFTYQFYEKQKLEAMVGARGFLWAEVKPLK